MAPSAPRGVHQHVVSHIGQEIVAGAYPEGAVLEPPAIMQEFGVSRTLVREVFRVLESKGLIEARPKVGTTVSNRSKWKLLDEDVMSWRAYGASDRQLLSELEEVRSVVEPICSRLCADRASDEHVALIADAGREIEESEKAGDVERVIELDLQFHLLILRGAQNELLEQFEVLLEPALRARNRVNLEHQHSAKFVLNHLAVASAIQERNGPLAETAMRELLREASTDTQAVMNGTYSSD